MPLVLMRLLLSLLDADCGDLGEMPLVIIVRAGNLSRGPKILALLLVLVLVRVAVWIQVLFPPMPAQRHLIAPVVTLKPEWANISYLVVVIRPFSSSSSTSTSYSCSSSMVAYIPSWGPFWPKAVP